MAAGAELSADGKTIEFACGAKRSADRVGVRYDLLSPIALARYAAACAEGAQKYGDFNCEKGMPAGEMLNHAVAHIYAYLAGDRSEDHLGHAMWNIASAIHGEVCWPEANELRSEGCVPPGVIPPDMESLQETERHVYRVRRILEAMQLQPAVVAT